MDNKTNFEYLLSDLTALNGVGIKTTNLLKRKNINKLSWIIKLIMNIYYLT